MVFTFYPFIVEYMPNELRLPHPARRCEQDIAFIPYVRDNSVSFSLPVAEIRFGNDSSDKKWIRHTSVFCKKYNVNKYPK